LKDNYIAHLYGGKESGKLKQVLLVYPSGLQSGVCATPGVREYILGGYATSQKVAGSKPDDVNEFFPICLILPALLRRGVYSVSNRNEYQKQKNVSGE
jgi:hypothetical protein